MFFIKVDSSLTGSKRAVKTGNTIFVSPAMHSLMVGATQEELHHLFSNLHYIDIGEFDFTGMLLGE